MGNGPARGGKGLRARPRKAKVTRSNRVGCARKARAERAGTVARRFYAQMLRKMVHLPVGCLRRASEPLAPLVVLQIQYFAESDSENYHSILFAFPYSFKLHSHEGSLIRVGLLRSTATRRNSPHKV